MGLVESVTRGVCAEGSISPRWKMLVESSGECKNMPIYVHLRLLKEVGRLVQNNPHAPAELVEGAGIRLILYAGA